MQRDKSLERVKSRLFAEEAMKKRKDHVPIEEIVYLDQDLHTYKYFMTGQFDETARKKDIMAMNAEA